MRFALALAFTLSSSPDDRWAGGDKVKHFLAAAAVQSLAYAVLHRDDTSRRGALWQATAVTAAASLGKEYVDHRRGGRFSVRDLAWDAGGAGAASIAIIRWSRK